jgi:hypothetical protein
VRGFRENDPLLLAFLDDFRLLAVSPLTDRTVSPAQTIQSGAIQVAKFPTSVSVPLSSELTFLTNEPGNTLRDRFEVLLHDDTRYFDCLVGYFFISGFYKLYLSLENVERIRILVGLQTDRSAYDLLQRTREEGEFALTSHALALEQVAAYVLRELESAATRFENSNNPPTGWSCSSMGGLFRRIGSSPCETSVTNSPPSSLPS